MKWQNKIELLPLVKSDLSRIYEWLNTPHVKSFWDSDINVTPEWVEEKYGSYVHGWKEEQGERLPLHAYTIAVDSLKIGYVQLYDAQAFPRDGYELKQVLPEPLKNLQLGAIDIFIGDAAWIGKGIGPQALEKACVILKEKGFKGCLVDPSSSNTNAISAYQKAGFQISSTEQLLYESVKIMIKIF